MKVNVSMLKFTRKNMANQLKFNYSASKTRTASTSQLEP